VYLILKKDDVIYNSPEVDLGHLGIPTAYPPKIKKSAL
jgi:hypothetical protein